MIRATGINRRRWLLCAAALAAIVPALTTAAAPGANATARGGPPRPVIDGNYLYAQLNHMATSFIYRVAGADGPPQDPSSPFNLPPTVNGANEFYAYWKQQMTDPAPGAMGPMGRFVTATDNFFALPRGGLPFDGDVAEVTIPGASCPGERALISGHNDSTPTSTRMATSAAQGDYTGVSNRMHVGNMGNGSPYDATSGEAMGMAELQALLRWYQQTGTWPKRTIKVGLFDAEETGLQGSGYYAANLIPAGPQGKYVMVANMDQNGIEYPAYHWGTDHYLNNITGGGVGPWYTNINAVPLAPNNIYPANSQAWANIQANMPAEIAFRSALQDSVTQAFGVLGQKYGFSVPLENPERYDQAGSAPVSPGPRVMPAYTPADQAKYSPVVDDALGRTDQVSFIDQGIPGFGVVGAYDSSNAAVGGFENPYPASYAAKPTLAQYAGYDTTNDTMANLNFWASGTVHGPGGPDSPSTELMRGLELPATWTAYLIQRDAYGGDAPRPAEPVAYFETSPAQPKTTLTVTFNASFSRSAGGRARGLKYFWDFGDGTSALGGPVVTHTYTSAVYADVKLAVLDGADAGTYRQAVPAGFDPSAAGSPPPPATDPCGTLTTAERSALLAAAQQAIRGAAGVTCRDEQLTGYYQSVNVPSGQWCDLRGASVLGSVTATGAAGLAVVDSTVGGSLEASDVAGTADPYSQGLDAVCGTSVGGGLTVRGASTAASWAVGSCAGSGGDWVAGDLVFEGNAGTQNTISGNTLKQDLQCQANGDVAGRDNTVAGQLTGQCSSLGYGPG